MFIAGNAVAFHVEVTHVGLRRWIALIGGFQQPTDGLRGIALHSQGDLELALWGARSKRHLLERVLARRVEVSTPDGESGGLDLSTAA